MVSCAFTGNWVYTHGETIRETSATGATENTVARLHVNRAASGPATPCAVWRRRKANVNTHDTANTTATAAAIPDSLTFARFSIVTHWLNVWLVHRDQSVQMIRKTPAVLTAVTVVSRAVHRWTLNA